MEQEARALGSGRGTSDPVLAAFLLAKKINGAAGGVVVAPWEVDGLPEEWIDGARVLAEVVPGVQAGRQQVEGILSRWRADHRRMNG